MFIQTVSDSLSVGWLELSSGSMKQIIAHIVSIAPHSVIRVILYQWLFGYRIKKSRIGFRTAIYVDHMEMIGSSIGRGCTFSGPMRVEISEATVGNYNTFLCGHWPRESRFLEECQINPYNTICFSTRPTGSFAKANSCGAWHPNAIPYQW